MRNLTKYYGDQIADLSDRITKMSTDLSVVLESLKVLEAQNDETYNSLDDLEKEIDSLGNETSNLFSRVENIEFEITAIDNGDRLFVEIRNLFWQYGIKVDTEEIAFDKIAMILAGLYVLNQNIMGERIVLDEQ